LCAPKSENRTKRTQKKGCKNRGNSFWPTRFVQLKPPKAANISMPLFLFITSQFIVQFSFAGRARKLTQTPNVNRGEKSAVNKKKSSRNPNPHRNKNGRVNNHIAIGDERRWPNPWLQ